MHYKIALLSILILLQGRNVSAGVLLPSSGVEQASAVTSSDDAQSDQQDRSLYSGLLDPGSTGFGAQSGSTVLSVSFAILNRITPSYDLQSSDKLTVLDSSIPPPPELLGLIKPPIR